MKRNFVTPTGTLLRKMKKRLRNLKEELGQSDNVEMCFSINEDIKQLESDINSGGINYETKRLSELGVI